LEQNACPRKCERRVGTVEKFSTKTKELGARIRIDEHLLVHVPLTSRGVLQADGKTITLCANGDRFNPIKEGTFAVVDIVYDADGTNPAPGLWAPKAPQQ